MFGEGGVGKTSLTRRYLSGEFNINTKMTMGATINIKYLDIENKKVALQIWDFGGEEQYRFLLPVYAYGSSAGIFAYDTTRYKTLEKMSDWLNHFNEGLKEEKDKVPLFMVGCKIDLEDKRSVSTEDAKQKVKTHGVEEYFECSAKTGDFVDEIFKKVALKIMKDKGLI